MVAPPPVGGLSSIPTYQHKKGPEDKRKVTIKGALYALMSTASLSILYWGQNFNVAWGREGREFVIAVAILAFTSLR